MGALLSIPFIGVGALTSFVGPFMASCCGAAATTALCNSCGGCKSSIATRIAYALLFLVNSILSWVMLTDWAIKKLEHLTLDYMKISCPGGQCYGFVAVHRINFALGLFHLILSLSLAGVRSSRNPRASLQNAYWGPKIIVWLAFIVLSFVIPERFFIVWGNYFAPVGSITFVLFGLILLVDFAHTWAETCTRKCDEGNSRLWTTILLSSTALMYSGTIVLTGLMYAFFAAGGCSMNQAVITINLILSLIVTIVSVNPSVQEFNPSSGIAQAGMVSIYCTYLTMSAVAAEPNDRSCNPLVESRGTRTASIVLGAIFTFLAIAYTTTRAATQGLYLSSNGYTEIEEPEHGLVTSQPSTSEMRARALRAAVESGSLPASALEDSDDDDDGQGRRDADDEKAGIQYNYTIFHLIFILATQYTATLLTMNVEPEGNGAFVPVGRSYFSSWTKIASAWVCYSIYRK